MVRYVVRALVLVLVVAVVPAPSAGAATAPPWRFAVIGDPGPNSVPTDTIEVIQRSCPGGYTLVGGGFDTNSPTAIERVAEYASSTTYTVVIHAYFAGVDIRPYPVCALSSHVGTIQTVSLDFARDGGTGIASGQVTCPAGKVALYGGADWNLTTGTTRRIDTMAPSPNGTSWMVSAYSPTPGDSLHAEAYCIASADLGGVTTPVVVHQQPHSGNLFNQLVSCPQDKRAVSGGSLLSNGASPIIGSDALSVGRTWNETPTTWRTGGTKFPDTGVYTAAWCIAASTPQVTFQVTPQEYSNATSTQFEFTAHDPVGEAIVQRSCYLDLSQALPGCDLEKVALSGLTEGPHRFDVTVFNASGNDGSATYQWNVDATAPAVSTVTPTQTLRGASEVSFTEAVSGVTSDNVHVRVIGTTEPVPGTLVVVDPETVTWAPKSALVPGQKYEVVLGSGIEDLAGNPLAPQQHQLFTPSRVEVDDPVVVERWDVDKAKAASGRSYASSRGKGSSLTWTFKGGGKRAHLYGVKSPTSGKAAVYVNGIKRATVSLYAASTKHSQLLFSSAPLAGGNHKVEVRVLGSKVRKSKGVWVGLDRLKVGTTNLQESAARHRFRTVSDSEAFGGSYDTVDHATRGDTGGGPSYSLVFRGTEVHVGGPKTPMSGSVRVYVDGVLKLTLSLRSSEVQHDYWLNVTGLSDAVHTLKLVPVGTATGQGSAVGIDAVKAGPFN